MRSAACRTARLLCPRGTRRRCGWCPHRARLLWLVAGCCCSYFLLEGAPCCELPCNGLVSPLQCLPVPGGGQATGRCVAFHLVCGNRKGLPEDRTSVVFKCRVGGEAEQQDAR